MRHRWPRCAASLAVVVLACGCAEPRSQSYAVTVLDSPTITCRSYADGLLADPAELEEIAEELRKAYRDAMAATPPNRAGRTLRINELETTTQAWFERPPSYVPPTPQPSPYDDASGEPPAPIDPTLPDVVEFDDPSVVYLGEPQDGYVEGHFTQRFDTDERDEEAGLRLCGARSRARGTLTLTTTDGAFGRVRFTEVSYVPSELCPCEGRIECVRDIAIEGLLVD